MPEDILSDLRAKEDELDALVEAARLKAASIREEALRKAGELKDRYASRIEAELEEIRVARDKVTQEEVARIEREADAAVQELRALCVKKMDRAVKEVIRFIDGEDGAVQ
ncbi:MAG: hypothetical protein BMS9Abin24_229 [Thermodesulfobacteriota bacterium]|nr:MAG: hypothetical protein BMS9Abin24_229 [Thermodesulfobacteriota bacterium]